jgi:hypothetical protein
MLQAQKQKHALCVTVVHTQQNQLLHVLIAEQEHTLTCKGVQSVTYVHWVVNPYQADSLGVTHVVQAHILALWVLLNAQNALQVNTLTCKGVQSVTYVPWVVNPCQADSLGVTHVVQVHILALWVLLNAQNALQVNILMPLLEQHQTTQEHTLTCKRLQCVIYVPWVVNPCQADSRVVIHAIQAHILALWVLLNAQNALQVHIPPPLEQHQIPPA